MQVLSISAQNLKVLLPVNMVAQIIGRTNLDPGSNHEFRSNAGQFRWREYSVPLLRTSQLMGGSQSADDDYERIVVLWPMKTATSRSFIGLTSLTPPRVVEITDHPSVEAPTDARYVMDCLRIENEVALIPDIDQVSTELFNSSAQED
jgi:chemotaxis signal transduction protein